MKTPLPEKSVVTIVIRTSNGVVLSEKTFSGPAPSGNDRR
jgi:hypothetical protein